MKQTVFRNRGLSSHGKKEKYNMYKSIVFGHVAYIVTRELMQYHNPHSKSRITFQMMLHLLA